MDDSNFLGRAVVVTRFFGGRAGFHRPFLQREMMTSPCEQSRREEFTDDATRIRTPSNETLQPKFESFADLRRRSLKPARQGQNDHD